MSWTFSEVSLLLWSCSGCHVWMIIFLPFNWAAACQLSSPWLFAPFILKKQFMSALLSSPCHHFFLSGAHQDQAFPMSVLCMTESYSQLNSLKLLPQFLFFWNEITIELLHYIDFFLSISTVFTYVYWVSIFISIDSDIKLLFASHKLFVMHWIKI